MPSNPSPEIRVVKEGPTTAMLTGDGGLGIIVAKRAMEMAMEKAAEHGVAVVTTVYHGVLQNSVPHHSWFSPTS